MKICFLALYYSDLMPGRPVDCVDRIPLLRHLPRQLVALGQDVSLVHHFSRDQRWHDQGVDYRFVASVPPLRLAARAIGATRGQQTALFDPATRAIDAALELEPDVLHVYGTILHLNLALLARRLWRQPDPRQIVVVQHHGGEPSRRGWLRRRQRDSLRPASKVLFSTREHAQPFVDARVIDSSQVGELMETSSPLDMGSRATARRQTGMTGEPVFLSAGRLHSIKDPFTVMRGFERIVGAWPEARLYLCYLTDELLPEIRAWLGDRPQVAKRVELLGRLDPAAMQAIYNSSDFLLQASRREVSGVAVLDAMACGVVPVVSDIPSLRAMVGSDMADRVGVLFPVGDDQALAEGVLAFGRHDLERRSSHVRQRFDRQLSFTAAARRLDALYRGLIERE